MGRHRTAWHLLASVFIDERRPRCVELETEVTLTVEPQRADLLLIRKHEGPIDDAQAFFRLWNLMGSVALVEYKSSSRPARPGVWSQLIAYAHLYARGQRSELGAAHNLSLFLMVHEITPTVRKDADWLGYRIEPSEGAYTRVAGAPFPTWIVTLNQLAEEEDEPLIGELGSRKVDEEDRESMQWLANFYMANEDRARNLEGFEELKARFMRSRSFLEMTQARFDEGRAEGHAEGHARGRMEGEAAVLLRLLHRRFGELPDALEQHVRTAKPELIGRWTDRILDADTLEDIFGDD